MRYTFTIDGELYVAGEDTLYTVKEEVTSIDELEEETSYLHDGRVGKFELDDGHVHAFDAVFYSYKDTEHGSYYKRDATGNLGDEFTSARRLNRIVPDQIEECPECGSSAGPKEKEYTPQCFQCGYGFDD